EDEQAVLYFQLMDFRHEQMLEYVNPFQNQVNKADYLRAVEGEGKKLTGIMEYYVHFFKGMYEFSKVYYKMSEIFYHMKQTHLSMYYIEQAYHAYKAHKANGMYEIKVIQCRFVIAGNYDDLCTHEKAIPHLKEAEESARNLGNKYMLAKALLNLGDSYKNMGDQDRALYFLIKAVDQAKESGAKELTQIYYELALLHFKKKEHESGKHYFELGVESAERFNDWFFMNLLNVLKVLYLEGAQPTAVGDALEELDDIRGYPYLEELALVSAEFYTELGHMDDSVYFYNKMIYAQKQIRRGEFLYEI
ncbi:tetratricopeptide repeat protein, partial [Bacillus paralicheniformis]